LSVPCPVALQQKTGGQSAAQALSGIEEIDAFAPESLEIVGTIALRFVAAMEGQPPNFLIHENTLLGNLSRYVATALLHF
jgi:hypothetical protein